MSGRQITVTDDETGHKGKIESVNDTPSLYVPDQKSGSDHCKKNPGEDRPERANKPKELCEEDVPDFGLALGFAGATSSTIGSWPPRTRCCARQSPTSR